MKNILVVIPARGGSKGVPFKNKKVILNKPLIQYTIDIVKKSNLVTNIVVSSDDKDIIHISKQLNIETILRPTEISDDKSPVSFAVLHAVNIMELKYNIVYDYIMLLQPTSPLRKVNHINESINKIVKQSYANSLISLVEMNDVHPARMYNINNNKLNPLMPDYETIRRQDIPPVYYRNGSIYIVKRSAFEKDISFMIKPSIPFIMDEKYLLNIDTPRDLLLAELLIKEIMYE